jgi:hypothetical protein
MYKVFLHRPEMPALERIYSQAVLTTKELVYLGDGKSSLINISDYCAKKSNHHGSGYI